MVRQLYVIKIILDFQKCLVLHRGRYRCPSYSKSIRWWLLRAFYFQKVWVMHYKFELKPICDFMIFYFNFQKCEVTSFISFYCVHIDELIIFYMYKPIRTVSKFWGWGFCLPCPSVRRCVGTSKISYLVTITSSSI